MMIPPLKKINLINQRVDNVILILTLTLNNDLILVSPVYKKGFKGSELGSTSSNSLLPFLNKSQIARVAWMKRGGNQVKEGNP
ncbi:MAG: hypothetical protein HC877_20225 [Thioploca sp.]|nr:hypothetical protein [Thioploca sp.]